MIDNPIANPIANLPPDLRARAEAAMKRAEEARRQHEAEAPIRAAAAAAEAERRAAEQAEADKRAAADRAAREAAQAEARARYAAEQRKAAIDAATATRAAHGIGPPRDDAHAARINSLDSFMSETGAPLRPCLSALVLDMDSTTEACRAASRPDDLIVLSGPPGVGKSVAAVGWLYASPSELPARRRSIWGDAEAATGRRWVSGHALSGLASFDKEHDQQRLFAVGTIVIDDIGQEYLDKNGFLLALIDRIVYERHAAMLRTLITTNLSAASFRTRYGERIIDRIRESGAFVEISGESRRKRQKPQEGTDA